MSSAGALPGVCWCVVYAKSVAYAGVWLMLVCGVHSVCVVYAQAWAWCAHTHRAAPCHTALPVGHGVSHFE